MTHNEKRIEYLKKAVGPAHEDANKAANKSHRLGIIARGMADELFYRREHGTWPGPERVRAPEYQDEKTSGGG